MRKYLLAFLAASVPCTFMMPAVAQVPESGALGLCKTTDTFNPFLWFSHARCCPDMRGPWVDGPMAKGLGLPAEQDRCEPATVLAVEPGGSILSFTDPFRAGDSVGFQAASHNSFASSLFEFCQHGDYPMGNVQNLPSNYAEFMAIAACDTPTCPINWNGDDRPAVQFGGGVCAFFGSTGLPGQHNASPFMAVGASMWLGCVTESGVEIRAGFSVVGGQQTNEPRR